MTKNIVYSGNGGGLAYGLDRIIQALGNKLEDSQRDDLKLAATMLRRGQPRFSTLGRLEYLSNGRHAICWITKTASNPDSFELGCSIAVLKDGKDEYECFAEYAVKSCALAWGEVEVTREDH